VVVVTVESPAKDVETRLLARDAGIDFNRIMCGGKSETRGLLDQHIKWLEESAARRKRDTNHLTFITADYNTPWLQIAHRLDNLKSTMKIDVIVVDYLDVVGCITPRPDHREQELKEVFLAMVNYARRSNALLITAQQLKGDTVRNLHKQAKAGKEIFASTGDVAGAKAIGSIADYMLLLMIDPVSKNRMQFFSMKARLAPSGEPFTLDYSPREMALKDPPKQQTVDKVAEMIEGDDEVKAEVIRLVGDAQHGSEILPSEGDDETPW
jgi:hypothetical protein